jgi:hypothetical protein
MGDFLRKHPIEENLKPKIEQVMFVKKRHINRQELFQWEDGSYQVVV